MVPYVAITAVQGISLPFSRDDPDCTEISHLRSCTQPLDVKVHSPVKSFLILDLNLFSVRPRKVRFVGPWAW